MNDVERGEVEALATVCCERGLGEQARAALEKVLAGERSKMHSVLRGLMFDRERRQGKFLRPESGPYHVERLA